MTIVGAESPQDDADAQVPSGWSSVSEHEHEDDMEYPNTDTESRDLCTTDSQPIDSHGLHSVHNVPIAVVGRQAKESLNLLRRVYYEVVHWWKWFFKLPTGSAGKRFVALISEQIQDFVDAEGAHQKAMYNMAILPALLLQQDALPLQDERECSPSPT